MGLDLRWIFILDFVLTLKNIVAADQNQNDYIGWDIKMIKGAFHSALKE